MGKREVQEISRKQGENEKIKETLVNLFHRHCNRLPRELVELQSLEQGVVVVLMDLVELGDGGTC